MRCRFFNPENDLALAQGECHYNPPANIVAFASDLDLLPLWYADSDDVVLTRRSVPTDWMLSVRKQLGISNQWMTIDTYWKVSQSQDWLLPWGWNYSLFNEWRTKGKSNQQIDGRRIRCLSSRENVIPLLQKLVIEKILPADFPLPKCLSTIDEVKQFVLSRPNTVLKSPWSSSGKGLCWTSGEWTYTIERWSDRLLKKQGLVMGEHLFEKRLDFAMEFSSCDGKVSFVGYSLFVTDEGRYKCNRLESDEMLELSLTQYVSRASLQRIKSVLLKYFEETIAPYYQGFWGVDMMVCQAVDGSYFVHPCVEINLRMNMGVVAHLIYERFVDSESVGEYYVKSFRSSEELQLFCSQNESSYPLEIRKQRILSGFLPLTFCDRQSTTLAYIFVKKIC